MWLNVITWSNLEEIDGDLVRLISNRVQDLDLGKNFIFISEFSQSLSQHFLALTSFITLSQRVLICSRPFKNIQENSDANRLTFLSGCPSCPNSSARDDTNFDELFRTYYSPTQFYLPIFKNFKIQFSPKITFRVNNVLCLVNWTYLEYIIIDIFGNIHSDFFLGIDAPSGYGT